MRSAAQILVPAKNCFFVLTLRVCGYILNAGRYFVKNATLDASAAARTAENEPEEVYLRFPKGKALPFENARECTSGRHVGAFAWVNMHQIMRDVLRGAFLESLILENGLFVEKTKI